MAINVLYFLSPKYFCKTVHVLILGSEQIEVIEKFEYLGSYVSAGGSVNDKIDSRIVKARATYDIPGHLWRLS